MCLGRLLAYVSGKLLHASRSAYALAATNPKSVKTIALLGDVDGQGTRRCVTLEIYIQYALGA